MVIIANFKLLRIWHVGTSNSFEPKSVHRFKPHQKRRTSNLPTHHDLISNLGIFVGVWKSSKFSFGEGIRVWRCLTFNLQNSKQFEIPYIWVRPNTIKFGSSNFIQYNIYYYYLLLILYTYYTQVNNPCFEWQKSSQVSFKKMLLWWID